MDNANAPRPDPVTPVVPTAEPKTVMLESGNLADVVQTPGTPANPSPPPPTPSADPVAGYQPAPKTQSIVDNINSTLGLKKK